jgi:hypothetical protein
MISDDPEVEDEEGSGENFSISLLTYKRRVLFSGMWNHVIWKKSTHILEECIACIFRVKESAKQGTSKKQPEVETLK